MLQVVEATQVDALVPQDTMLTSNRCLSSRSMSNSRCDETRVVMVKVRVSRVVMVVDRLLGRACTMMFPSQLFPAEVVPVEVSKEVLVVEAIGAQFRLNLDQPVLLLPTHQLDQRMLVSQGRTIGAVEEPATEASILMLAVDCL